MRSTLEVSESLIGSLCREIEYIRGRYKVISTLIVRSNDEILKLRLRNESSKLKERKKELELISDDIRNNYPVEEISSQFLNEVIKRPLELIEY